MYQYVLMLHLIGATIWTGGHLVLALCILPAALRQRSPALLLEFEKRYERLGMSALIVQVVTGAWLASLRLPDAMALVRLETPDQQLVLAKIGLLLATLVLAASARLRVIPRLTAETLPVLVAHIVAVTVLSVLFVVAGAGFRFGGFF